MELAKNKKKDFEAKTILYNVRFYKILLIWVFENFLRSPLRKL